MANGFKMVDDKLVQLSDSEQKDFDDRNIESKNNEGNRNLEILRSSRNQLLAETDYLALSDVTMSDAWKNYRQELRDITKKFKSINDKDFKFPDKPKS
jgi:phosphomannomutase